MSRTRIYQIYYSKETSLALDPGFIPLNNTNGRPDWMEYWAIRKYFLDTPVTDDLLIGFFSPRFNEKTGLNSADVHSHIADNPDQDIYLFNPYFHLAAWHPNVFIQAENSHPGITDVVNEILELLKIDINVEYILMNSQETIFCNYFVATVPFWKQWLMICEFIFQIAEEKNSMLSQKLEEKTSYIRGAMPMKIFIIERIASLLMSEMNNWKKSAKYIYKDMHYHASSELDFMESMHTLDSLKIAFKSTNNQFYLDTYKHEKNRLINQYSLIV